jgi:hypothetical protein
MKQHELRRLKQLASIGDMDAAWSVWRDMERSTGLTRWTLGTLPDLGSLAGEICRHARRAQDDIDWMLDEEVLEDAEDIELEYDTSTGAWRLLVGLAPEREIETAVVRAGASIHPSLMDYESCLLLAVSLVNNVWRKLVQRGKLSRFRWRTGGFPDVETLAELLCAASEDWRTFFLDEYGEMFVDVHRLENLWNLNRADWNWVDASELDNLDSIRFIFDTTSRDFVATSVHREGDVIIPLEEVYETHFDPELFNIEELMDVRLRYVPDTDHWNLHTGDPSYDQDHRGVWATGHLNGFETQAECEAMAQEMLNELWNEMGQM